MQITFYGAAQNVTGSKHLIESNGFRILLDCGLHQGHRQEANQLNRHWPFRAKDINAVILSHAHLDHCGLLPVLARAGFGGQIYATTATAELARLLLEDSAGIQAQDAAYINRHLHSGEQPVEPLYTKDDIAPAVARLKSVPYFRLTKKWTQINDNIRFKFYDAGHILGSAVTLLEIKENGAIKTLAFTGDLGRVGVPILRDPELIAEPVDTLLMEATYGDRNHEPPATTRADLGRIITDAVKNKSKIIVPAFSLGRTQELIYILHQLFHDNNVPRIPIYLDSPLAVDLTRVFARHAEDFDAETWHDFDPRQDLPFVFKDLKYVSSVEESKTLNAKSGPLMIISASGMMEAGRVVHHLKNNIEDPNAVILITGYQAADTLGRRIQAGEDKVKIFHYYYNVRAQVITMAALSAHADQRDLLNYLKQTAGVKNLFLVHTEFGPATVFKGLVESEMPSLSVRIPWRGQNFTL